MRVRVVMQGVLMALAVSVAGCGVENPVAVAPSPFVTRIEGVFAGPLTLTDVRGGECVGPILSAEIGLDTLGVMSVTQTGANVLATLTDGATGLSCRYTGTAGLGALALNSAVCEAPTIIYRCSDGSVRDVKVVGSSITATADGPLTSGVVTTSYNVFETGTEKGVAGLVTTQSFDAVRR
jgi:hypothetical protein